MIPALLGRELGAGLLGDEASKRADLALELARLVVGLYPVCDALYSPVLAWGSGQEWAHQ